LVFRHVRAVEVGGAANTVSDECRRDNGLTWVNNDPGRFDGRLRLDSNIVGKTFRAIPSLMLCEGDLLPITNSNTSHNVHSIHLHGHHVLVLSQYDRSIKGVCTPYDVGPTTRNQPSPGRRGHW